MAKQVSMYGDDYRGLRLKLPATGRDLIEAASTIFEGPAAGLSVFYVPIHISDAIAPSVADEVRALHGRCISPRDHLDQSLEGARFLVVVSHSEWQCAEGLWPG